MNFNMERRWALLQIIKGSVVGTAVMLPFWKTIFAMGTAPILQQMHRVEGIVKINNTPAKPGDPVVPGDKITTGPKSSAVFICGHSAYLIRENSQLIVDKEAEEMSSRSAKQVVNVLRLLNGKMMAVFGSGKKIIQTPSAYIGISGTGVYLEVDNEKTF